MEANLHSHPGFLIAKPGGAGRKNLEITQECMDATDILQNSEALQQIVNSIGRVHLQCKLRTGQHEISNDCTAVPPSYPESLVDEINDVCEDEGGRPVLLPDATIFCNGTCEGVVNVTTGTTPMKVKFSVAFENVVTCLALSCEDTEDLIDFYESAMAELKQEMQRDLDMNDDVNCWVDGGGRGLSGGAIAGIVIGSVFGAALLLAIIG
jgi:hypothetical protein